MYRVQQSVWGISPIMGHVWFPFDYCRAFHEFQNGTLKLIDRKKHIFKLAQGEYIAPEKIENIYVRSTLVAQIFVHGESLKVCMPLL